MGGLNDVLTGIYRGYSYCKKFNRILLINGNRTQYQVNFSDYFKFSLPSLIYDTELIKKVLASSDSFYPSAFKESANKFFGEGISFKFTDNGYYSSELKAYVNLPSSDIQEKVIISSICGGNVSQSYEIFKNLGFTEIVKSYCHSKRILLPNSYLCIHARNTDLKCNLDELLSKNEGILNQYRNIYLATDHKESINFLKSKLPSHRIFNFCSFPERSYNNLHGSDLSADIKIKDLLSDICIALNAECFISNSKGLFVQLLRILRKNKNSNLSKYTNI